MEKFPRYPNLNLKWIKENLDLDRFLKTINDKIRIDLEDEPGVSFVYNLYLEACFDCLQNEIEYYDGFMDDLIAETGLNPWFNGYPSDDILKSSANGSFLSKISTNFKLIKKIKVESKRSIGEDLYNQTTRYDIFYSKKNNTYYVLKFFRTKPTKIYKNGRYEYYDIVNRFLTQKKAFEFMDKELKKIKKN